MRKNSGMHKTQEYTFEVLGPFVYCDEIYRASSEVQCETVSYTSLGTSNENAYQEGRVWFLGGVFDGLK